MVDDNVDLALSLKLLLESFGYIVYCAYEGNAALRAARKFLPDVVILDIGLPGLDGLAVARRLRTEFPQKDLLLIAATGYGQKEDVRRSHQAGFDFHLVKPLDIGRLRAIIAAHDRE